MNAPKSTRGVLFALVCACIALPMSRVIGNLAFHGGRTSAEVVSRAYTAAGVGEILGGLALGLTAARFGGRRTLLASLFALALSSVWAAVWVPPEALIALFAIGAAARVGVWCSIIAVIAETRDAESGRVVATGLAAATTVGWVLGTIAWGIATAMVGTAAVALLVPLLLLGIGLLARATLRDPSRTTELREGSGYRDVEVIEQTPQPLARLRALISPELVVALVLVFAAALARTVATTPHTFDASASTRMALALPAGFLAAIMATIWVRDRRFLILAVAVPLGIAAVLSPLRTSALGSFLLAFATGVSSATLYGAIPFVVGRDREGAPIVAGLCNAAALVATSGAFWLGNTRIVLVAGAAVGVVAAAWLSVRLRPAP